MNEQIDDLRGDPNDAEHNNALSHKDAKEGRRDTEMVRCRHEDDGEDECGTKNSSGVRPLERSTLYGRCLFIISPKSRTRESKKG